MTGATGFIGRHVVAELERRGLHATLACRDRTPAASWADRHTVVELDVHDPPADPFAALGEPDTLVHLAWGGLPNYRSLHHFEDELPAHYRFLKSVLGGGLGHVVIAGTCLEYGMQSGALHEDLVPSPTTPYGFAKNALRVELEYLRSSSSFALTWARLFYLYGPGQAASSLYPQLEAAAAQGERVFNMSGGNQLRDYSAVSDIARHLVTLALGRQDCGVVNVCSGRPIAVADLVESWMAERGWTMDLNRGYYPYPDYEPMEFWGDRRKMDRCLAASRES